MERKGLTHPHHRPYGHGVGEPHGHTRVACTEYEPNVAMLDPRLVMLLEPGSDAAAAYRVARHQLFSRVTPQVVAVTSPVPYDGLACAAINIAVVLAETATEQVLLIDGDVRNPVVATELGIASKDCFVEQLEIHRGVPELSWTAVRYGTYGIDVMATGSDHGAPRLDGAMFEPAIAALRTANYSHVVICGPPILGSAEINVIHAATDALILCVEKGRCRMRDIVWASEQLPEGALTGAVLVDRGSPAP